MPDLSAILRPMTIGPATTCDGVAAIPLFAPSPPGAGRYVLLSEAMARGALVVSEAGAQDRLSARNRGATPVFVLEGDHVLGAKQNRAIVSSALLRSKGSAALPVACVERGRSSGLSQKFDTATTVVPASLRRIVKASVTSSLLAGRFEDPHDLRSRAADQDSIWSQIAEQQRRLRVASATASLAETYAARSAELFSIAARLPCPTNAVGIALALDGELLSIDVFDKPSTCAHYWPQLVQGAALDALDRRRNASAPGPIEERLRALLARLGVAPWRGVPAVDDGQELRVALDDVFASALLADGALLHLGVASTMVHLRSRPMRFELPAALATRYRVAERIGVGGTKEVYRAEALATGASVAIARIPRVRPSDLEDEVALSRRVASSYTIEVFEALLDEHEDGYVVMEYFPGANLAQLCAGGVPLREAGPIMLELTRAVAAVHRAAVLHRDIKLENVLLAGDSKSAQLKLIDFGTAASARCVSTAVGELPIRGTAPYMSREVLRGQELDARADTFSLGVCFYRLLTGQFPLPPEANESTWDYLQRLLSIERYELGDLPPIPPEIHRLIARMLHVTNSKRPFVADVLPVLERAFGALALTMPRAFNAPPTAANAAPPDSADALDELTSITASHTVEHSSAATFALLPAHGLSPDNVLVAPCAFAPLVTFEVIGISTQITGHTSAGARAWSLQIPGIFTAGLRADLDRDGLREIYLAGTDRVAALSPSGSLLYSRYRTDLPHRDFSESSALFPPAPPLPTFIAIADPQRPRLVVDGRMLDPRTGRDMGRLPFAYEGDGRRLADVSESTGLSYNGFALQGFRGARGTAAAIVHHPGAESFCVAQLELAGPRVLLGVYGPGGKRTCSAAVASYELPTGDRHAIAAVRQRPPMSPSHAPLAVLGEGSHAVVIVPLVGSTAQLPSGLAAFSLPGGHELWRTRTPARESRALLADFDGDGKPELLVGTGEQLLVFEPWTGASAAPVPCQGLPIAFGDPFGEGVASLVTVSERGVHVARVRPCRPFQMQWSGPRGDQWRTGTVTRDGMTLGPV